MSTGLSFRENLEKKPGFFSFSEFVLKIEAWSDLDLTFAFGPSKSFRYEWPDFVLVCSSGNGSEVVDWYGRVVAELVVREGERTEGDFGVGFFGDCPLGEAGEGRVEDLTGVGGGDAASGAGGALSSGSGAFFFFLGFFFFFFLPALGTASSSSISSTVVF